MKVENQTRWPERGDSCETNLDFNRALRSAPGADTKHRPCVCDTCTSSGRVIPQPIASIAVRAPRAEMCSQGIPKQA